MMQPMDEKETTSQRVVMVAVDKSAQSQAAFNWYMNNYYRVDHYVIIAHCVELPVVYGGRSAADQNAYAYSTHLRRVREEGQQVREKYTRLLEKRGVPGRVVSSMEDCAEYWIVDRAKSLKAELIVMGSKGVGALQAVRRKLIGSVSDHVMHHAHCAVAIYHL